MTSDTDNSRILSCLKAGLDELDLALLMLDADLRPHFANRALLHLFGVEASTVLQQTTFRTLLHHAAVHAWRTVAPANLAAFLDEQEALVRAGTASPRSLDVGLKGHVLLRCTACPHGGRLLTYALLPVALETNAEEMIEHFTAEMRFHSELMEEQGARLAELAESAELNAQRLDEVRTRLERELAERRLLEKQLRRLATTDALTGVLNRAGFMARAQRRLAMNQAARACLTVLMVDVDHFKQINDRWGHEAGDQALKGLADRLRAVVRRRDLLGRLGGEEFAVVLSDTAAADALLVAERLRSAVAASPIRHDDRTISLTVSVGVAMQHETDSRIGQIIRRADAALYRAKESGRNRVMSDAQAALS
ncbi:MAG: GGDEF domain-containing protein [Acetobacteraceae bacterium]|nr:GGDEF domain-containing protein [Pseudomonadota bacterium]